VFILFQLIAILVHFLNHLPISLREVLENGLNLVRYDLLHARMHVLCNDYFRTTIFNNNNIYETFDHVFLQQNFGSSSKKNAFTHTFIFRNLVPNWNLRSIFLGLILLYMHIINEQLNFQLIWYH
jgi:hypothetical protein